MKLHYNRNKNSGSILWQCSYTFQPQQGL